MFFLTLGLIQSVSFPHRSHLMLGISPSNKIQCCCMRFAISVVISGLKTTPEWFDIKECALSNVDSEWIFIWVVGIAKKSFQFHLNSSVTWVIVYLPSALSRSLYKINGLDTSTLRLVSCSWCRLFKFDEPSGRWIKTPSSDLNFNNGSDLTVSLKR